MRLVEERSIRTGCQPADLRWKPDGAALVVDCSSSLQAWSPDGRLLASTSTRDGLAEKHLQPLADPSRVVYLRRADDGARREEVLTSWELRHDRAPVDLSEPQSIDSFSINQDQSLVALVTGPGRGAAIKIVSLPGGQVERTIEVAGTRSLRWIPGAPALLLGSYDGVLRRVDTGTGQVRELARPYASRFAAGGGASGILDGLVLAPDGKAVATFMLMASYTGRLGKQWAASLGTTIDIRFVSDGRVLDHMPGTEIGARGLAWDPQDRFIAVAGHDALFVWNHHAGTTASRTYGGAFSIAHIVCINKDGTRLALTTGDGLRIFRVEEQAAR